MVISLFSFSVLQVLPVLPEDADADELLELAVVVLTTWTAPEGFTPPFQPQPW